MEERRRNRRMELTSRLLIKNLTGTGNEEVSIEVTDMSKTGVGFICESRLDLGTVYEAFLTIWMKESLHAFLEIVRIEKLEDNKYNYGAIFIGMSEMDTKRIEVFDTMGSMEN
ncbi:MAG: PilZ domain-containing protein [Bacillus sp. (in: Bacteria)]|nr:PilZ domain-containing protein [Bacillus sp. (in: firmicutes)]MCM1427674.1 PilZ domain-containing protein [Eubacterium sp.]